MRLQAAEVTWERNKQVLIGENEEREEKLTP